MAASSEESFSWKLCPKHSLSNVSREGWREKLLFSKDDREGEVFYQGWEDCFLHLADRRRKCRVDWRDASVDLLGTANGAVAVAGEEPVTSV